MQHHNFQHLHSNQQNFHENSLFKSPNLSRTIPKTAPRKTRNETKVVSSGCYDISEEDFFGSMLSVDVQPIYHPKRISKTPIGSKRKRKNYDNEIIPIPKINTQKFNKKQEIQRASTTTSVTRPTKNNLISSAPSTHFIPSYFSQTMYQFQIPESQSTNLVDPLTIKQIDTRNLQKKSSKESKLSITYGSISPTRKIIQKPHSSCTNRSKSPKKMINAEIHDADTIYKENKNNTKIINGNQISNEKDSIIPNDHPIKIIEEKNTLPVKFDKKAFLQKLDNEDQDIRVRSTISFANGRVLPSLHYQKEPDRYVIACAIHPEFTFNFFTLPTNPVIEKHLIIDVESYDLFDSSFEYSNRLYRSSNYIKIQKEILKNSCYKDPLTALMSVTPSLTRRNIEKQHFFQQMKILSNSKDNLSSLSSSELSNQIQKKYPNGRTTDSAFPLISSRIDCSKMPSDVIVEDSDDDDQNNDNINFCMNDYSCNLSNLKKISDLL